MSDLACEQASLARSDGEGEREGKPARDSENRQCTRPKFGRKVLIGRYIIIHDITVFCPFPVQKKKLLFVWRKADKVFFVRLRLRIFVKFFEM